MTQEAHEMPVPQFITRAGADVLLGEAFRAIVAERMEQVQKHSYTLAGDQMYAPFDLPLAATSYANAAIDQLLRASDSLGPPARPRLDVTVPDLATWPWDASAWKPGDPRANLVKAAALIWAAIDRIDHEPVDAGDDLPDIECEFCLRAAAGTITNGINHTFAACLQCITAHRTDPNFFGDKPRDQAAAA